MIVQAFGYSNIMAMTGSSHAKQSAKAVDVEKSVGQVEHVENSVDQDEHLPVRCTRNSIQPSDLEVDKPNDRCLLKGSCP